MEDTPQVVRQPSRQAMEKLVVTLLALERVGGCSWWTGSVNNRGYGQITIDSQSYLVHRALYVLEHGCVLVHGPIPKRLWVHHTCEASYPPDDISYRRPRETISAWGRTARSRRSTGTTRPACRPSTQPTQLRCRLREEAPRRPPLRRRLT